MGQQQASNADSCGLPASLTCACEIASRALRDLVHVGGLGEQEVSVSGEVHDVEAGAGVTGVEHGSVAGRQPHASVGHPVRQEAGLRVERADGQPATGGELVQDVGGCQHRGVIESEHRVQGAGYGVHRQRHRRIVAQRSRPQQRVQIGAVVRMAVADEDRVDLLGREVAAAQLRLGPVDHRYAGRRRGRW
jgi:hypothetical protein